MSAPAPAFAALLALAAAAAVLGAGAPAARLAELTDPSGGPPARSSAGATLPGRIARLIRGAGDRQSRVEAGGSVPATLALELRAGRALGAALAAAGAEHDHVPDVSRRLLAAAAAVDRAADPVPALLAAPSPVVALLRPTAACLSAGQQAGLPLADLLESAAAAAYDALELSASARAELSGARASALLLAGLPLAGLALGQLMGASPGRFLLSTPGGRVCLVGALVLTVAGWAWTRALGRRLFRELSP